MQMLKSLDAAAFGIAFDSLIRGASILFISDSSIRGY